MVKVKELKTKRPYNRKPKAVESAPSPSEQAGGVLAEQGEKGGQAIESIDGEGGGSRGRS